jgi:hypothetical protein
MTLADIPPRGEYFPRYRPPAADYSFGEDDKEYSEISLAFNSLSSWLTSLGQVDLECVEISLAFNSLGHPLTSSGEVDAD